MEFHPLGWLLGIRVIERTDQRILMRVPRWLGSEGMQKAVDQAMLDYPLKNPGKRLEATVGHRLIRFDIVGDEYPSHSAPATSSRDHTAQ